MTAAGTDFDRAERLVAVHGSAPHVRPLLAALGQGWSIVLADELEELRHGDVGVLMRPRRGVVRRALGILGEVPLITVSGAHVLGRSLCALRSSGVYVCLCAPDLECLEAAIRVAVGPGSAMQV